MRSHTKSQLSEVSNIEPKQTLKSQREPRNHRYTYSEYLALRNQGDQHLVAITPLMQTGQNLQSQHFRMSQSIKETGQNFYEPLKLVETTFHNL